VAHADPPFPQQGHAVGEAGTAPPVGGGTRVEDQGAPVPSLVGKVRVPEDEQMERFPREGGDGPFKGGALPLFSTNFSS